MPSVSSESGAEPVSTSRAVAALPARASVIALSLLPLPSLEPEPRHQNGGEQERDHRRRDCGAFAKLAAENGALIGIGRHQVGGVDRAAARHHPNELEVGE